MLYILIHISWFMIFASELLCTVYFICTLEYGNDVRQKQIQVIFLFERKMGHKTVETAHNINNVFGPGIANEHIVQWSLKFCKGNKSLKDEKHRGQPSEVDYDQLRGSSKLILQPHEKLPKNSMLTVLWSFSI